MIKFSGANQKIPKNPRNLTNEPSEKLKTVKQPNEEFYKNKQILTALLDGEKG